ncbi:MAG: hypothetical protein JWM44_2290 [Bacilli bacterium]|nr:hypothetical protein [Bacilli bacterium]
MQVHETGECNNLISYLTNESSVPERTAFERHLQSCSLCREELRELRLVWDALPYQLEEVEVPLDLKAEVMQAIPFKPRRIRSFSWIYKLAAAVIIGIVIGAFWNNVIMKRTNDLAGAPLNQPAEVIKWFGLKTADSSMPLAHGDAWILQHGKTNKIVVDLKGLAETQGDQAYQVWLIRKGNDKRYNCGTLHVDVKGNGLLTYDISAKYLGFDAIGVTLESDPNGSQPRGKKVLGS